ncbi:MAG TPA: type I polyketide synthase [Zeimonas sp.]|nr:type I polyketide synthase [Zeimonas sp.]
MSNDFLERIGKLSPKRLALLALELHEQLEAGSRRPREPIAVIGMACRLPGGANDPDAFWKLLSEGRDAIREVPADRWDIDAYFDPDPDAPARMSVRSGGFLDRVDGFDSAFFGISPREALTMDPQQRLLLEVTWEALEHAGVAADRLAGSATGVFIGVCNSDHFQRVIERGSESIDAYLASGNAHSVASGRLSYFLGLQGPALSIDTACSSSLVALHVACQSLRSGESRMALSGGVNLMCAPETTIALTKAHMLAPDGRCKTFDAAADGFARGEGCAMLVLKRLSDAVSDGDRILAVIRGIAANQDGRSGGLTVPNGPAQEAVIGAALADGGLQPTDIGYVEAHGTGTSLGDPIEVRALAGALGRGRSAGDPLLIGSVKTNLGHLESAAGVAGVMKTILSLQHQRIPPHLHFRQPSPHIAWSDYPVKVEPAGRAWPRGDRPRRAGVSSFGFSGTNAHVIIEEAPIQPPSESGRPLHCLPLSARTPEALRQLALRYADALGGDAALSLADVAHTAGAGRSHFDQRLAVVAADVATACAALRAFARGEPHPALHRGVAVPGKPPEVVFLFTGQGSQYPGMARGLYEASPVFREVIDRCNALLGPDTAGRTLLSVLVEGTDADAPIHDTVWTQPALFAVECALTQLWRSWGIEPAAVIGHSVGEYIAACVAGVYTLEEGLRLIAERGRLMQALPAGGSMAAVFASPELVAEAVAPVADRVAIAAVNAPDSVVISGAADAVDALLADLEKREIRGQRLFVSLAAHSPLVAPALDAMEACARTVTMRAPDIPVAWNLTGGTLTRGEAPDASYWRRHLREPVRFAQGVSSLYRDGYRTFLEVGPHPTLTALAQRSLPEGDVQFVNSLRRSRDDWHEMLAALATLYVNGAPVDWAGFDRPWRVNRVTLPTYPFERRSYWIGLPPPGVTRPAARPRGGNALLGARLSTAMPTFEVPLAPNEPAYLADHRVRDAVLVAGPVFMEMAQACAREAFGPAARSLDAFAIQEPLVLPPAGRVVQISFDDQSDGSLAFRVHSRAAGAVGPWQLHVTGKLVRSFTAPSSAETDAAPIADIQRSLGAATACTDHYERLARMGIDLGPSFRSLQDASRRDGEALASVALAPTCAEDAVCWAHPALLDGALQAVGMAVPQTLDGGDVYLFTEVGFMELAGPLPSRLWCHARLRDGASPQPAEWRADVTLRASDGSVLGSIRDVRLRRASKDALARFADVAPAEALYYRLDWEPAPAGVRAARSLDAPARFMRLVRERFHALALENDASVYEELLPELDRLSAEHVASAFHVLGFDSQIGRRFTIESEAAQLGVVSRHTRLFGRLVRILAEEGVVRDSGQGFEVAASLPTADPMSRYGSILEHFKDVDAELSTLRRCGGELARVLTGVQDPLHLLFPGGSFAEARKLYVESPYARTFNGALAVALRAAIATLPEGSRLRVLEIGAGTGGTTTYVLPLLPVQRVEYTFTDLSTLFLDRAAEQFQQYPFMRFALLDIERDPSQQGFDAGHYDVVIAANVLHATADLRQALFHARALLAPGGILMGLEGVAPERWVDLTFGLTEGWWRFTDTDLRPDYPLIGRTQWRDLLTALGFTDVTTVPDDSSGQRSLAQQALIVARAPARRWALLGDHGGIGASLARRLEDRGDAVTQLPIDAFESALPEVDDVVYLGALELTGPRLSEDDAARRSEALACSLPLRVLGRVAQDRAAGRIWLVTQGTQAADSEPHVDARWQAPLWGVGRVFALEHPARWGGLIDLPSGGSTQELAETLLDALDADDGEDQTAWRNGARLACRLVPAPAPETQAIEFRADATYLVTGGFGGLGLLVARWMADRGAKHIALLGRHADAASPGVRAIEALGARVFALEGDVADEASMRRVMSRLSVEAPPLRGVMHAAAALSQAPISSLTADQVTTMFRPKVGGTLVLQRLTRELDLDFLVLFSSTTALLGAAGLAHYAAANLFLDATARAADQPDRRVLSVNWGTWEAMRLASAESRRSFREAGLVPMRAAVALDALGRLMTGNAAQAMVAQVDWSTLKPLHEARRARPFLSRLSGLGTTSPLVAPPAAGPRETGLAERLAQASPDARRDLLVAFVQGEVAAVLGLDAGAEVSLTTGLFDLGMDSLMAVELRRRLESGAGCALPSTLTFNYPNVHALAGFLERLLGAAVSGHDAEHAPAASLAPAAPVLAGDDLDALSEDELEARLAARLEQLR